MTQKRLAILLFVVALVLQLTLLHHILGQNHTSPLLVTCFVLVAPLFIIMLALTDRA